MLLPHQLAFAPALCSSMPHAGSEGWMILTMASVFSCHFGSWPYSARIRLCCTTYDRCALSASSGVLVSPDFPALTFFPHPRLSCRGIKQGSFHMNLHLPKPFLPSLFHCAVSSLFVRWFGSCGIHLLHAKISHEQCFLWSMCSVTTSFTKHYYVRHFILLCRA